MNGSRLLIVDDEAGIRNLLKMELGGLGHSISTAANGEEALEQIRQEKFDLVISDITMPKLGGMELLEILKKENPLTEVIIITGFGTIETAVSAMKKGAYDFIQKPFNLDEILVMVEKALEKRGLKALLGMYESSREIFSSINLESLLPTALELALKIFQADDASLLLADEDGTLTLEAAAGLNQDEIQKTRLVLGERIAGKAAKWREPLLLSGSLQNDPRFSDVPALREISSAMVFPLILNDQLLGVLDINRTRLATAFNSQDMLVGNIFSSQIAQAISNAQLYAQLRNKMEELKEAFQQLEQAQEQLIQAEKMSAIGQLAAGVAHELNNPLTGIMGFSEIVLESNDLPAQAREDIESIYTQSKRCRQIIQNLLQFSRRKESHKEPIDLIPLIRSTLQLLKYDFSTSGIELVENFPDAPPLVFADPAQMQQVFLNLIGNSKHAMEDKRPGTLTVGLRTEADKAILSFQDTGSGIPEAIIGKIFDPFFTTKAIGKGTGLGLSITFGIIQQHNGIISVESEVGKGTTFHIQIPIYHEPK